MPYRILRDVEVVRAGDEVCWLKNAWAKIEYHSEFVGQMVIDLKENEMSVLDIRRHEPKVYVLTVFQNLLPLRGWCCDRNYAYINDVSWQEVKIQDIMQIDVQAFYSPPIWAEKLMGDGQESVTAWTNYYE